MSRKQNKASKIAKKDTSKAATVIPRSQLLRAGYVVVGDVHARGCTTYNRGTASENVKGDEMTAEWETLKHVANVKENDEFKIAVNTLRRSIIRDIGTSFGTFRFIPETNAEKLDKALRELDEACVKFNTTHRFTSIRPSYFVYRVEANDSRMAKITYGKLVELATSIDNAVQEGDMKGLRTSLTELNGLDTVLPSETYSTIKGVVANLREQAREAVRAAKEKAGTKEQTEKNIMSLISRINVGQINAMRASFVETEAMLDKETSGLSRLPTVSVRQVE